MKITRYNKKRQAAEIELGGKTRFISAEAAIKLHIDLNRDIPEDKIADLLLLSDEILCRQYLFDYVAKYVKTKRGYFDKLIEKGYLKQSAQKAVDCAENYGYINDAVFAQRYVEINSSKKGKFALKNELRKKGVPSEIIEETLENMQEQDESLLLLAKKLSKNPPQNAEERNKLARKLASRGFPFDSINRVIDKICSQDSQD